MMLYINELFIDSMHEFYPCETDKFNDLFHTESCVSCRVSLVISRLIRPNTGYFNLFRCQVFPQWDQIPVNQESLKVAIGSVPRWIDIPFGCSLHAYCNTSVDLLDHWIATVYPNCLEICLALHDHYWEITTGDCFTIESQLLFEISIVAWYYNVKCASVCILENAFTLKEFNFCL